jgi:hypothetical protein
MPVSVLSVSVKSRRMNTTLADLFELRIYADPFSTVQASVGRLSGDEGDDGVTDGRQAWLRRRSIDFFPSRYFEAIGKVPSMYTSKDVFCEFGTIFESCASDLALVSAEL